MAFEFDLGEKVRIEVSGETGEVRGRAEYSTSANNYLLRYCTNNGQAVENWWQEDALKRSE